MAASSLSLTSPRTEPLAVGADSHRTADTRDALAPALAQVEQMLRRIRYGELTIKIRDGQVVLIERLTRMRLR